MVAHSAALLPLQDKGGIGITMLERVFRTPGCGGECFFYKTGNRCGRGTLERRMRACRTAVWSHSAVRHQLSLYAAVLTPLRHVLMHESCLNLLQTSCRGSSCCKTCAPW